MNIMRNIVTAALMTVVTTLLLGIVYPLAITGIAQALFPDKANGQLIERNGKVVGSRIIGQGFSSPGYFRSRPSAAGTGYDAANSAGTQLGPTNKKLVDNVKANVEAARKENATASVPIDLVTTSASGLDPHLSPAAADFQVPPRCPRARDGRGRRACARRRAHRRTSARVSRRTARERARTQSRARRCPSHESARKVARTSVRMKNRSAGGGPACRCGRLPGRRRLECQRAWPLLRRFPGAVSACTRPACAHATGRSTPARVGSSRAVHARRGCGQPGGHGRYGRRLDGRRRRGQRGQTSSRTNVQTLRPMLASLGFRDDLRHLDGFTSQFQVAGGVGLALLTVVLVVAQT